MLPGFHGRKSKNLNVEKNKVMAVSYPNGISWYILALLLAFVPSRGVSQKKIEIVGADISRDKRNIEIKVKAMESSRPIELDLGARGLQLFEMTDAVEKEARIQRIERDIQKQKVDVERDTLTLFFLLDAGDGVSTRDFDVAKGIVREVMNIFDLQAPSKALIATYGSTLDKEIEINFSNLEGVLSNISTKRENPDFYRALAEVVGLVNRPRKFAGKKLLFVLSSGKNNILGNPIYSRGRSPISRPEILSQIRDINSDVYIFPISITPNSDKDFLSDISKSSPQANDRFEVGKVPGGMEDLVRQDSVILQTHVFRVVSNQKVFIGKKITYKLRALEEEEIYEMEPGFGTVNNPVVLSFSSPFSLLLYGLTGLLIVLGVLGIFSFLLPTFRQGRFKKEHVVPFIEDAKRRIFDPMTRLPIKQGDMVVKICSQTIPFETWKVMGWQCPEFPDCMQNPQMRCNGKGAPMDNKAFFSMRGDFRKLNWFWFGLVGGYLSWCMFAFVKISDSEWYKSFLKKIYQSYYKINPDIERGINLDNLADGALIGGVFGFGLLLLLGWVEERGQSRKFSFGRIVLRTLLGTVICSVVSALIFVLQFEGIVVNVYLVSLLNWLLIGLAIGVVLSVRSSVLTRRGLIGGLLSGLAGFVIYIGFSMFIQEYYTAKLLSLISMGGLLGLFVVTVSERVEDFEIEFISPREFQRVVPISKWLKSGVEVAIGIQQSCDVYIKWPDYAVLPKHATLHYERGSVMISPIGDILLNGQLISKSNKVKLKNGDIIKLGRDSETQLIYKEKVKYE